MLRNLENDEKKIPFLEEASLGPPKVFFVNVSGKIFQCVLGVVGLGVIVLYIKSSENCVADARCIDKVLAMLPDKYTTGILIICGGLEYAFSSALYAMESVPKFLNYIAKSSGFAKFLKGASILTLAAGGAMESMLIAIKAFPSVAQALVDPKPWISLVSSYPLNLFGVSSWERDIAYLFSLRDQLRGYYKGKPIENEAAYQHLWQQYVSFRKETKKRFEIFVSQASQLDNPADAKEEPLEFLYQLNSNQEGQLTPISRLRKLSEITLGLIGAASAFGCIFPVFANTYNFLYDMLMLEESSWANFTLGLISLLMGSPRMRALIEKTIKGTIDLINWEHNLRYQLNPKTTILLWLIQFLAALPSYAVLKDTTLRNFPGRYEQLLADYAGDSIINSHFVISLQFSSAIFSFLSKNYFYKVESKVKEILSMTFEEFGDFVSKNESHLFVLKIKKYCPPDKKQSSIEEEDFTKTATSIQSAVTIDIPQTTKEDESTSVNVSLPISPRKSWAKTWCTWFTARTEVIEQPTLNVENNLGSKKGLS